MKSIIFSIFLLIGGVSCLGDSETLSAGIIAIGIAIVIIFIKVRLWESEDRNQSKSAYSYNVVPSKNEEYDEYLQRHERYEAVERKWKSLVDKHYKLMEDIGVAYTVANNLSLPNSPQMEHVVNLCKKDIELAEGFKEYWQEHRKVMVQAGYCEAGDVSDVLPGYPSFKRLAIIYEKQKRFDEAIAVCQHAIDLGFSNDGTDGQMPGRIARLMRKKGKEAKKLPESEPIIVEK